VFVLETFCLLTKRLALLDSSTIAVDDEFSILARREEPSLDAMRHERLSNGACRCSVVITIVETGGYR
jgi:hypothetical protein